MSAALVLAGYALLVGLLGPRSLSRAAWAERAPRLAIVLWQSLGLSALASVALAGLALAVPTPAVSAELADLLQACVMALRAQYATPGGAAAGATGAVLALGLAGRAAWCVAGSLRAAAHCRRAHHETLDLIGSASPRRGVVVLEDPAPAVYCLPGARRRIVVTAGALRMLDGAQLEAALAHERAHLAERHDLLLAWSGGLARAFPRLALFRRAHSETLRLVEMVADDVASRRNDRLTLAEALLNLAATGAPAAALGAGGSTAAGRVQRLIAPGHPLGGARSALGSVLVAAVLVLPLAGLAAPAAASTHLDYCPSQTVAAAP